MTRFVRGLLLSSLLVFPVVAQAAAPAFIPVQGYLTDAAGQPVSGDTAVTVKLYTSDTGGTAIFSEMHAVYVEEGYFTLYMGQNQELDLGLFAQASELYLGITVGSGSELSPRLVLGTTPFAAYAEHAGDAATLGGQSAAEFAAASHTHDVADLGLPDGLANGCSGGEVLKWDGAAWACAEDVDTDTDTHLTEADVDQMVSNNGYAAADGLAPVATSGAFADLTGIPADLADGDDDTQLTESQVDQYVSNNGYALASSLSPVAVSGSYADLANAPETVGGLSCASGEIAKWDGAAWSCAADAVRTNAELDALYVNLTGDTMTGELELMLGANGTGVSVRDASSTTSAERTGIDIGLMYGNTTSATGASIIASSNGTSIGVDSFSYGGNDSMGVKAVAYDGTNKTYGLYAYARGSSSTSEVYAGYFDGDVGTTADYRYTQPRTGYASVLAPTCVTANDAEDDLLLRMNNYAYIYSGTASYSATMNCPVDLPDGATIAAMRCTAYDNDANGAMSVYLMRQDLATGTTSTLGNAGTSLGGVSTAVTTVSDTTIANPQVDNASYGYSLQAILSPSSVGSGIRFYNCRIEYTIDQLTP